MCEYLGLRWTHFSTCNNWSEVGPRVLLADWGGAESATEATEWHIIKKVWMTISNFYTSTATYWSWLHNSKRERERLTPSGVTLGFVTLQTVYMHEELYNTLKDREKTEKHNRSSLKWVLQSKLKTLERVCPYSPDSKITGVARLRTLNLHKRSQDERNIKLWRH